MVSKIHKFKKLLVGLKIFLLVFFYPLAGKAVGAQAVYDAANHERALAKAKQDEVYQFKHLKQQKEEITISNESLEIAKEQLAKLKNVIEAQKVTNDYIGDPQSVTAFKDADFVDKSLIEKALELINEAEERSFVGDKDKNDEQKRINAEKEKSLDDALDLIITGEKGKFSTPGYKAIKKSKLLHNCRKKYNAVNRLQAHYRNVPQNIIGELKDKDESYDPSSGDLNTATLAIYKVATCLANTLVHAWQTNLAHQAYHREVLRKQTLSDWRQAIANVQERKLLEQENIRSSGFIAGESKKIYDDINWE